MKAALASIHTFAQGQVGRVLSICVAGVANTATPRPVPDKPWRRLRGADLAASGEAPPPEPPEDDAPYSEDLKEYLAFCRVWRGQVRKIAFYDAHGDVEAFDYNWNPRFRAIGERYLLLRFSGALVLVEGENLRAAVRDLLFNRVAEVRVHRDVWPSPDEGQPLVRAITVFEQREDGEPLTDMEQRLARDLGQGRGAGPETPAQSHG